MRNLTLSGIRASALIGVVLLGAATSPAPAQARRGIPPAQETTTARRPLRDAKAAKAAKAAERGARAQVRDSAGVGGQQALVREIRQRFAGVVHRQLNLTPDKAQQFDRVDRQYERQRAEIQRSERQSRIALKAAMEDTANVDQAKQDKIAGYLNELTQSQRRRADLLEAEQKELSGILTPLQRARLQALREQFARRIQQVQAQGRAGGPPPQ